VKRNAKGQRCDDREGKQERPAAKDAGERYRGADGQSGQPDEPSGAVAQVDDRSRVPLVAEDQGREED
jgi:hypothetical protein